MKNNIPRDKKLLSIKIEQFVTLCSKGISYKNTSHNSCIKFGSMRWKSGCIGKTTKNFEMRISRRLVHKEFKRGFMMKKWTW